jgi:hypothetical protein
MFFNNSTQEFVNNEGGGEPPLEGSIPDMTSLTESVSFFTFNHVLLCTSISTLLTATVPELYWKLISSEQTHACLSVSYQISSTCWCQPSRHT